MRNANKSPKIPYSAMLREAERAPESAYRTQTPPEVNQFFQLLHPIIMPSVKIKLYDCFCSNPAHRQNYKQTDL